MGKAKGTHHGQHGPSHCSKPHGAGERLCFGIALERGGEQVYRVPLAGMRRPGLETVCGGSEWGVCGL